MDDFISGVIGVIFIGIIFIFFACIIHPSNIKYAYYYITINEGMNAILKNSESLNYCIGTKEINQYTQIKHDIKINDIVGVNNMYYAGDMAMLTAGTKILIVEKKWSLRKVRVLDGIYIDNAYWIDPNDIYLPYSKDEINLNLF
jgi:hypothetical protein